MSLATPPTRASTGSEDTDGVPKKDDTSIFTDVIHGGEPDRYPFDSVAPPIIQSSTFRFAKTADLVAYFEGRTDRLPEYGRYGNPTVRLLEQKVAAIEHGEDAAAFSSGMAAVTTTLFAFLRAGSHVVLFADCYRRTRGFVSQLLSRYGVEHTLVPACDLKALREALRPETRMIVSEAPTNPYLRVTDLDELVAIAKENRIKTLIDSTFATPFNLRPLDRGVDLVIHSATKYLAGHNDVLGGLVIGSEAHVSLARELRGVLGSVLDPNGAALALRGVKTLALRIRQQNETALALARALEAHPKVRQVWYPMLPSHPDHEVATRIMRGGGGVVTFELDADLEMTGKFIDSCKLPRIAPSFGGVETLIEQPALMSYFELAPDVRRSMGITDGLVRFAAGIEDPDEIIADVMQALEVLG